MGKMSRNKGARGEREILGILQPVVDSVWSEMRPGHAIPVLRRNYTQRFESKQYDIIGLPWAAVEVKRCENLSGIGSWWKQVLAATRPGQTPILIYRQNHGKWRVRMKLGAKVGPKVLTLPVDITIEVFLVWFEYRLRAELLMIERVITSTTAESPAHPH